jgi:hypothetical protein
MSVELLRYARHAIGELTGLEHICQDSPEWPKGQMATIPLPPCDPEELKRRLAELDEYRVEVPIISWGGRQFALWGGVGARVQYERRHRCTSDGYRQAAATGCYRFAPVPLLSARLPGIACMWAGFPYPRARGGNGISPRAALLSRAVADHGFTTAMSRVQR